MHIFTKYLAWAIPCPLAVATDFAGCALIQGAQVIDAPVDYAWIVSHLPHALPPPALFRILSCLLLAGCTVAPDHPALRDAALPDLLQAHRFAYRGTTTGAYQLSPDGNKLAWIGPSYWRSALFVRNRSTGEVRKYRAPAGVQWTADSRRLLYGGDASGSENPHVFMIDTEAPGSDAVDLTPFPGVKAAIQQISATDPRHVLVTHNRRNLKLFDLYRIDLDTRIATLVSRNPGDAVAPIVREDGAVQGWQQSREAQRSPEEKRQPQAVRGPVLREKKEGSVRLLASSADPQVVWALSNRGRDRMALVAVHTTLGWEKPAYEDPTVDVTGAVISRVTRTPLLAYAQPGYPRVAILDDKLRADLEPLLRQHAGGPFGLELVSADRDEQRMVLTIFTSTRSHTYLLDRASRSFELLSSGVPESLAQALASTEPVKLVSRDGLPLQGYLTLPRGAEPHGLPMVLLVHGGPWLHTPWGDPLRSDDAPRVQFLANRGYAVLQVDFRGSSGHGRDFYNAGIGEFAGRMQDDLLDAVQWATARGIADPARIAIMGWSYGGYASLVGLAATPKTFACGISIAGPTDLASLIESFPPYWTVDLSTWHDFVGNPKLPEDRADMTRRSPLTRAAQIERPVLLIHGERDVRVRIDQSQRMADALRQAGKPVRFVPIAEMGHTPGYWAHQQKVLRETETFLHGCIGGRASRFDPFDALAWVWTRVSR